MSLLSHDATVEPDLGPVDHWKTQSSVLRREQGKVNSCGSAGFWFWILTLTLGSGTCAQGGRVHRAGAAQDIHPLAPFLQKKTQQNLVSKNQKRVKGRFLPLPPHPPGLALLQGGALGLHGVVNDAAGPPGEIHGDQGVLRHAPLWRVRVGGGGRQGSEVKQARQSRWGMTDPVCTREPKEASRAFQLQEELS